VCSCGEPISGEELAKLPGDGALVVLREAVERAFQDAVAERRRLRGGRG
jgi:hypothetical protein